MAMASVWVPGSSRNGSCLSLVLNRAPTHVL
jgi:hypothetical protein